MKYCIYYISFVFIKKNYFYYIPLFFMKGDNSVKNRKGDSPHVLIQIILLHGFDVCISIVRLNRYIIHIILLHDFYVCISIVRLNRYVIYIILLHRFDVCISIVRLNRYVILFVSNLYPSWNNVQLSKLLLLHSGHKHDTKWKLI